MNIPKLIKEAHGNAVERGFFPEGEDQNIGELLMLIISELGEALEAHRCEKFADMSMLIGYPLENYTYPQWKHDFENFVKDTFEDEIADVFIRLFSLCGYLDLKIENRKILHHINWDTDNIAVQLKRIVKYIVNINEKKIDIIDVSVIHDLILSFCALHNIPIEKHIKAKMAYNRTRPHKHGKEY